MKPCEHLSRRQRRGTPVAFGLYLLSRVWALYPTDRVAVLWTQPNSNYGKLFPWVQLWSARNDARTYPGPYPVICHPPCGPWGKYKHISHESKEHGIIAIEMVHRWGGVIEQPSGSSLFREYGRDGWVEKLNQHKYNHLAKKPTILYFANPETVVRPSPQKVIP